MAVNEESAPRPSLLGVDIEARDGLVAVNAANALGEQAADRQVPNLGLVLLDRYGIRDDHLGQRTLGDARVRRGPAMSNVRWCSSFHF